ncbi:MAG: membrane trafficking protein [Clostridiaceae bacterium]
MNNGLNKKLADLLGKMDDKVLQSKLNAAVDMLKGSNNEELAKKLSKIDKNEVLSKLNELDDSKLKELNLNKADLKQKLNNVDLNAVQKMLGDQGPEIINKIKDIIK